jgi:hypothetical protein
VASIGAAGQVGSAAGAFATGVHPATSISQNNSITWPGVLERARIDDLSLLPVSS